jgi:hypothetical protein
VDNELLSRRHLTLTPLDGGRIRVSNHYQVALTRSNGAPIPPNDHLDLAPPFDLQLPGRTIRVLPADQHGIISLSARIPAPNSSDARSLDPDSVGQLQPEQMRPLIEGMDRALIVLQNAVGAADFRERASQALVQIVGLDTGRVLLRDCDRWNVVAAHGIQGDISGWQPSRHIVNQLLTTRKTVWQRPQQPTDAEPASLRPLDTVVAAPLLDCHDQVIGILYGERHRDRL